jgi:hypothetical protein
MSIHVKLCSEMSPAQVAVLRKSSDFTNASISPPLTAATLGLKKEEDHTNISMSIHNYENELSQVMAPTGDQAIFSLGPRWS